MLYYPSTIGEELPKLSSAEKNIPSPQQAGNTPEKEAETDEKLFNEALALGEPWFVERSELDVTKGQLVVYLNFKTGGLFRCATCLTPGCRGYDSRERAWRHLDFLHYQTVLVAPSPRVTCPECGVRQAELPWARPRAKFSWAFEYRVAELARHMPLREVAEVVDVNITSLRGIARHYAKPGDV